MENFHSSSTIFIVFGGKFCFSKRFQQQQQQQESLFVLSHSIIQNLQRYQR